MRLGYGDLKGYMHPRCLVAVSGMECFVSDGFRWIFVACIVDKKSRGCLSRCTRIHRIKKKNVANIDIGTYSG